MLETRRSWPIASHRTRKVAGRHRSSWPPINGARVLFFVLLLLTACAPAAGRSNRLPTVPATATPPPPPSPTAGFLTRVQDTPLPAFTDWRVAYIGPDQRVHAVALDGKRDVVGPAAAVSGPDATGVWTAGTSADGKHLAYYDSAQLTVVDTASGARTTYFPVRVGESAILWSPNQRYISFDDTGYVLCVNLADGSTIVAPQPPAGNLPVPAGKLPVSRPYGWLDARHVAVQDSLASAASVSSLQSLDVITGQLRPIATIQVNALSASFDVEPGGELTLFSDGRYQNVPFTPVVDLINNATGAVTPLPGLTNMLPESGFTQVLWRPGSSQAIAATGFPETGDLKYYLIDVSQDTATPVDLPGFPEGWSPDGGTLIVATGSHLDMANEVGFRDIGVVGSDPFTLIALTMDGQGRVRNSITLTRQATTIPLLGFVRTA